MPTATLAGATVDVNDEGFFTDPAQWTEADGRGVAAEGIDELTDRHWQVIRFMRDEYLPRAPAPTVRVLGKTSGVPSRSSTSCSPRARRRSPPRSPASPSPAAASDRRHDA